jgi:hypothetical protein
VLAFMSTLITHWLGGMSCQGALGEGSGLAEPESFEGRFQILIDHVRIDHGGGQVTMPERLLDQANILGLPVEFRRKRMPQQVML